MSVPVEPLWDIFTPEVIAGLQRARLPSERLRTRVAILHAGGLNPSQVNRELRAFKAAWEALRPHLQSVCSMASTAETCAPASREPMMTTSFRP
jgi:hypothetical protein